MARKTAIRITNAEIRAAEHAADSRRDASPTPTTTLTTVGILRAGRDMLTEHELLDLARDAAALELRSHDPEDRKDAAAEAVCQVLAECNGAPPYRDSRQGSIAHLRGICANYRKWLDRERRRTNEEAKQRQAEYAASPAAILDRIITHRGYLHAAGAQSHWAAAAAARHVAELLGLSEGGTLSEAVYALLYQWVTDRPSKVCAEANGVSDEAWRRRYSRGAKFIAANVSLTALVELLTGTEPLEVVEHDAETGEMNTVMVVATDCSRDAAGHAGTDTGKRLRDQAADWRTGAASYTGPDGTPINLRPEAPEDADAARMACQVTHRRPAPKTAAANLARLARPHLVKVDQVKPCDRILPPRQWGECSPRGYVLVQGRPRDRALAQAIRRAARASIKPGSRERAVRATR